MKPAGCWPPSAWPTRQSSSFDVATSKARNAYYFSTREGYSVLRNYVDTNPYDHYTWTPDPPAGQGWAITNRTLSFGGQPLFPPGIDLKGADTRSVLRPLCV